MDLTNYVKLCECIVILLNPLVEIVIHDLYKSEICYIEGGLSKRKVGDSSLLHKDELEIDLDKVIYPKICFDGRLIKSVSIAISEQYLICINCDVSIFNKIKSLSEQFLQAMHTDKPNSLFKNDWQEKLHVIIHEFLNEEGWKFEALNGSQKKILIKNLYENGAFEEKNAANYISNILNMGRATIFKYLKEWRSI